MSYEITRAKSAGQAYLDTNGDKSPVKAIPALGLFNETILVPFKVDVDGRIITVDGSSASSSFATGSPVLTPVGPTSSIIALANSNRKYLRVSNYTAEKVWIQYGAAAESNRGQRLLPGSVLSIISTELYTGDVHAITEGASVDVDVFEGTT